MYLCWVNLKDGMGRAEWTVLCGTLTVVRVDEVRCLRGVIDELNLADLPHLDALVTELLQHAHKHTHTRARASNWLFFHCMKWRKERPFRLLLEHEHVLTVD